MHTNRIDTSGKPIGEVDAGSHPASVSNNLLCSVNTDKKLQMHVDGAESWSWADIRNNGSVTNPGVNIYNELQVRTI